MVDSFTIDKPIEERPDVHHQQHQGIKTLGIKNNPCAVTDVQPPTLQYDTDTEEEDNPELAALSSPRATKVRNNHVLVDVSSPSARRHQNLYHEPEAGGAVLPQCHQGTRECMIAILPVSV